MSIQQSVRQLYDDVCKEKDSLLEEVLSLHKESKNILAEISENSNEDECLQLMSKLKIHLQILTSANAILKRSEKAVPQFSISTDSTYLMKLSFFKSSTEFWLRPFNDVQLDTMKEILSTKLKAGCLVEHLQANVGDIVVAPTSLHGNIRAVVLDCTTTSGLHLLDIDCGKEVTTKQKVFELDDDLMHINQQAVCCGFSVSDPLLYEHDAVVQRRLMLGELKVRFVGITENSALKYLIKHSVELEEEVNNNICQAASVPSHRGKISDEEVMSVSSVSSLCQPLNLQDGSQLDVIISYVVSPNEIYVYAANKKTANAMDRMHEKMQMVYKPSNVTRCTATVGDLVAVFSNKDAMWIRGKIVHKGEDEMIKAVLIDFGDTVQVPEVFCANLIQSFHKQAPFVQQVALSKVYPLDTSISWPAHVTGELRKMIQSKLGSIHVVTSSSIPQVTLSIKLKGKTVNINTLMVTKNLAASELKAQTVGESAWPAIPDVRQVKTDVVSEEDVRMRFNQLGQYSTLLCTRPHINTPGTSVSVESEHVLPTQSFNTLDLPRTGGRCYFKLTQLICVNNMFCVFTKQTDKHGTLADLVAYMNVPQHSTEMLSKPPIMSQMVLCKDIKHGLLQRARIVDIKQYVNVNQAFVKVFYVDNGSTEWTETQNLRVIHPKFLHLPFQAVEVHVQDMEACDTCVGEARDKFTQLVEQTEISANFISSSVGAYGSLSVVVEDLRVEGTPVLSLLEGLAQPKIVKFA